MRKLHQAGKGKRGVPSFITAPRLDVARTLHEAGCTIRQIAHIAWDTWGYQSEQACRVSISRRFHSANVPIRRHHLNHIPEINRTAAIELVGKTG